LACARKVLGSLMRYSYQRLRTAGAELAEPKGGFYVFPNFSAARTGLELSGHHERPLCERAIDKIGVAFLPGLRVRPSRTRVVSSHLVR
jgi:aspartate aminotransferase